MVADDPAPRGALTGKVAVVVGGPSGVGRTAAPALARRRARVVVADLRSARTRRRGGGNRRPPWGSPPAGLYLGTVPYEEVLRQTAACHAIAALYDPAVPNNRLAAPNKVYEAMMLAKPLIVSDGIAIADLVRSLGCGKVVPYGDRAAVQRALEELMLSPAGCDAMGARGRAAFERAFNWKAMESRLLDAYASLAAQKR